MGARDLLADLANAGLRVTVNGDRLLIRPASRRTDGMRAALRDAKAELLVLLRDLQTVPESIDLADEDIERADLAKFQALRSRMVLRGWTAPEADVQAVRLAKRDREQEERVSCTECRHYHPARCGNFRRAGLSASVLSRDLIVLLQWCPGFEPVIQIELASVQHPR